MAAFLKRLFGSATEEENKNKGVREQRRRYLLSSKSRNYTPKEMKAARNILDMKKTQSEYSQEKMRDAGEHMAVKGFDYELGQGPSRRKRKNRSRRKKISTSYPHLKNRTKRQDTDIATFSKISSPQNTGLNTILAPFSVKKRKSSLTDVMRQDMEDNPFMGGKTRKRRRKRRRKTKRKGRRKTKKRRKMRTKKTKRRR